MNGQTYTEDYILGRFIPLLSDYSTHSHPNTSTPCSKSLTQTYYDGDFCYQNGKERETQVRYFYQTGITQPRIMAIIEASLCVYIIRVAIPPLSEKTGAKSTHITCHENLPLSQKPEQDEDTIPKVFETQDLIDLKKSIWIQKLKAIVSSSNTGLALLNSALREINQIENSIEKNDQSGSFSFQKWIQLLGLEVDKIASSVNDDETKKKSDEDSES